MAIIWTDEIPTIVFVRVTEEFSKDLKKKYGFKATKVKYEWMDEAEYVWNKFSTSQVSETPPEFPYITIIQLPGQEIGQDLEGTSINGGLFAFQVDVYHNASESAAKECMSEVTRIMKSMRFDVSVMPSFESKPQEYRMTARFSRIIGAGDAL
jgi:hypothetical protein